MLNTLFLRSWRKERCLEHSVIGAILQKGVKVMDVIFLIVGVLTLIVGIVQTVLQFLQYKKENSSRTSQQQDESHAREHRF